MFLRQVDLTTAQRPSLLPEETLLFVQDAVGLYSGKSKLQGYQDGQAYLTSHRACYVDNADPRKRAVAIDLKDVDHGDLAARFLKSSPKVTLFPKATRLTLGTSRPIAAASGTLTPARTDSPIRPSFDRPPPPQQTSATWICSICSFSNPVPSNFDPALANDSTPLAPCLACGIKPSLSVVVKAAVASLSSRPVSIPQQLPDSPVRTTAPPPVTTTASGDANICRRCTFENHPSLHTCEICGASLQPSTPPSSATVSGFGDPPDSPGLVPDGSSSLHNPNESIKFSFRAGGEKVFHDRLKQALTQKKWLLQSKPKHPSAANSSTANAQETKATAQPRAVGIAGLERRGDTLVYQNKNVLENAFEDIDALMASAKEIIALAEQIASQTRGANGEEGSAADGTDLLSQLNLTTTKDMLSKGSTNNLFIRELSRSLAEYLTDDTKGILKHEGGIISLVDLWAVFNRARGGMDLISPSDFAAATELFDELKLPVRRRQFRSGLVVVQERSRTDEKTVASILSWLEMMHSNPPDMPVPWDWQLYGQGATPMQAADFFGWSVGVASEELEMAEEHGVVCRDVGVEGVRFWKNFLVDPDFAVRFERKKVNIDKVDASSIVE